MLWKPHHVFCKALRPHHKWDRHIHKRHIFFHLTSFSSPCIFTFIIRKNQDEIKEREKLERIEDIQGNKTNIEWGNQIRSYVFMPYTLVKDTRTGYEDGNIQSVMDGNIDGFINAYLKMNAAKQ